MDYLEEDKVQDGKQITCFQWKDNSGIPRETKPLNYKLENLPLDCQNRQAGKIVLITGPY